MPAFRLVSDYQMTGHQPTVDEAGSYAYGRLRMSCVPMRRRITLSPSTSKVSR